MPSQSLQKRYRPLLVLGMPKQRHEKNPASKSGKGGQLTIASKMAGRVKEGNEALKAKAVAAKGKGGSKRALESPESSELEESESENSSAGSSLVDILVSQKTMHTEEEAPKRRKLPDPPKIEVTCHFSIFVHSHVLI